MMGEMVESASSTVMFLPVRRSRFARVSPSSHSSTMQLFSWTPAGCGMRTLPCARTLGSTRKFENFLKERHSSRHSSLLSNTFTAIGVPLGVCALKIVACPPRLATSSNARFCGAWRMSLCSGTAGVKSSSCEKEVLGAATGVGVAAGVAVACVAAPDSVVAASGATAVVVMAAGMVTVVVVTVDDPVPVRSSWFMPTPFFCVWAFVRDAAS